MKHLFLHGLFAGAMAGLAAFVYNYMYCGALLVDFSKVISPLAMFGASIFGTVLASVAYFFWTKWVKNAKVADTIFNIVFLVLSFASFLGVFGATLPLDIEAPELFYGLAIPMHLFPVMFWLAAKPLFAQAK